MELDLEEKILHWELGIDRGHDEGTETLSTHENLKEALVALASCNEENSFIDLWFGDKELGQSIYKKDLVLLGVQKTIYNNESIWPIVRFNLYALTFLYLFVYLYHWFKN